MNAGRMPRFNIIYSTHQSSTSSPYKIQATLTPHPQTRQVTVRIVNSSLGKEAATNNNNNNCTPDIDLEISESKDEQTPQPQLDSIESNSRKRNRKQSSVTLPDNTKKNKKNKNNNIEYDGTTDKTAMNKTSAASTTTTTTTTAAAATTTTTAPFVSLVGNMTNTKKTTTTNTTAAAATSTTAAESKTVKTPISTTTKTMKKAEKNIGSTGDGGSLEEKVHPSTQTKRDTQVKKSTKAESSSDKKPMILKPLQEDNTTQVSTTPQDDPYRGTKIAKMFQGQCIRGQVDSYNGIYYLCTFENGKKLKLKDEGSFQEAVLLFQTNHSKSPVNKAADIRFHLQEDNTTQVSTTPQDDPYRGTKIAKMFQGQCIRGQVDSYNGIYYLCTFENGKKLKLKDEGSFQEAVLLFQTNHSKSPVNKAADIRFHLQEDNTTQVSTTPQDDPYRGTKIAKMFQGQCIRGQVDSYNGIYYLCTFENGKKLKLKDAGSFQEAVLLFQKNHSKSPVKKMEEDQNKNHPIITIRSMDTNLKQEVEQQEKESSDDSSSSSGSSSGSSSTDSSDDSSPSESSVEEEKKTKNILVEVLKNKRQPLIAQEKILSFKKSLT